MPLYDYKCTACNHLYEVRLTFAEADTARPKCPQCGARRSKRQIGVALATNRKSRNRLTLEQAQAAVDYANQRMGTVEEGHTHEAGDAAGEHHHEH